MWYILQVQISLKPSRPKSRMNSALELTDKSQGKPGIALIRSEGWQLCAAGAIFLVICLLVQWRVDAGAAPFGTYPDEPAHYIGGLLIRDYAVSDMSQTPLAFAQNYYKHVPYFAIGYWPPLFYCIEAVWVMLFGPGRPALLLLSALLAAGSAALIFYAIRQKAGALAGICGGLIFLSAPEVQRQICTTMLDLPVTLGVLAATILAVRYVESGRWADSIGFALVSAAALLTKYSAAYICVLPFLMVIVLRRWHLLRRASFWIQPAVILALVVPWLLFTEQLARQLMELDFVGVPGKLRYSISLRSELFLSALFGTLPWPAWLLVVAGLSVWIFRRERWATMSTAFVLHLAALLAFLIASSVLNEKRYFTAGVAALVIAGLCGWPWLQRYSSRLATAALLGCTLLAVAWGVATPPALHVNNIDGVVKGVLAQPRWQNVPVFVASDAEGPMIAEFAMLDPSRPKRYLIRPGKVLSVDNWFGANYRSLFQKPSEVQSLLSTLNVGLVILPADPASSQKPHDVLLREAVAGHPEMWLRTSVGQGAAGYDVFERVHSL